MYVVRYAYNPYNTNLHVTTSRGEDSSPSARKCDNSHSFAEVVDMMEINLPQVDPMEIMVRTFLIPRAVDVLVHRDEVVRKVDMVDGDMEQYLVRLGDGTKIDVITYDVIVNGIYNQLARDI